MKAISGTERGASLVKKHKSRRIFYLLSVLSRLMRSSAPEHYRKFSWFQMSIETERFPLPPHNNHEGTRYGLFQRYSRKVAIITRNCYFKISKSTSYVGLDKGVGNRLSGLIVHSLSEANDSRNRVIHDSSDYVFGSHVQGPHFAKTVYSMLPCRLLVTTGLYYFRLKGRILVMRCYCLVALYSAGYWRFWLLNHLGDTSWNYGFRTSGQLIDVPQGPNLLYRERHALTGPDYEETSYPNAIASIDYSYPLKINEFAGIFNGHTIPTDRSITSDIHAQTLLSCRYNNFDVQALNEIEHGTRKNTFIELTKIISLTTIDNVSGNCGHIIEKSEYLDEKRQPFTRANIDGKCAETTALRKTPVRTSVIETMINRTRRVLFPNEESYPDDELPAEPEDLQIISGFTKTDSEYEQQVPHEEKSFTVASINYNPGEDQTVPNIDTAIHVEDDVEKSIYTHDKAGKHFTWSNIHSKVNTDAAGGRSPLRIGLSKKYHGPSLHPYFK